jgi:hypothetical protein
MPLDNKISNIIGTKLPQWVLNQLETRSNKNTQDSRDNDNILYLANKSAWVRLVSSVNVSSEDMSYFKNIVGANVTVVGSLIDPGNGTSIFDPTSLAKQYVLFGGTSKYLNNNSYGLRSGIDYDGAYGMLGNSEVQQFGYKPMPGISNVTIETQGRLGSVRGAIINFKCWDKNQLDIIDALYFKLGFTMFLEWGHTFFYPSPQNTYQRDPNKIISTELYSIDPFEKGLNKEDIQIRIAKNSRETEGNYDAMLGICTNFNFTYTQDGGYDCTLRLMGLGVLGDSIKINNAGTLPGLLEEEIRQLNSTLIEIAKANEANQNQTLTEDKKLKTIEQTLRELASAGEIKGTVLKIKPSAPEVITTTTSTIKDGNTTTIKQNRKQEFTGEFPKPDTVVRTKGGERYIYITRIGQAIKYDSNASYDGTIDIDQLDTFRSNLTLFNNDKIGKFLSNLVLEQTSSGQKVYAIGSVKDKNAKQFRFTYKTKVKNDDGTIGDLEKYITFEFTTVDFKTPINTDLVKDKILPAIRNALNNQLKISIYEGENNGVRIDFRGAYEVVGYRTQTQNNSEAEVENILTGGQIPSNSPTANRVEVVKEGTFKISTNDTAIIKDVFVDSENNLVERDEYLKKINSQNQVETTTTEEDTKEDQEAISTQIKQALNYQSTLEIMLRTIQLHALNKAINKTGKPDLEVGRTTYVLEITKDKTFLNQIFSTGVFSSFIDDLVDKKSTKIKCSDYSTDKKMIPIDRFKIYSKYGFATSLLGNKEEACFLQPVDFEELLKAYVVPYQINQEIIKGTSTNHPVYIPLGLVLMILNHACTIYDRKEDADFQAPLVYIDFNPELNFCLTNTKQLSTDPWTCLIPFEGGFEDYKQLFDKDILISTVQTTGSASVKNDAIQPTSGSNQTIPLFNPETQDYLSGTLPKLKFDEKPNSDLVTALNSFLSPYSTQKDSGNIYRGKMMNILMNIDYLVNLAQQYSYKDGTNSVYLKSFIEQILSDINKSLGNFNAFRLSYNDSANTFQIVDDQFIPSLSSEPQVTPKSNTTEIPLVGKFSIAKSLEIKSEVSSRLSNMLAISANPSSKDKAVLSSNADSFGFINTAYTDRYITIRGDVTSSFEGKKNNDSLKISAAQFNSTISDFYSKINPSQTSVAHATNYYIEKMSLIKNEDYPTRAAAMIPVSVNFTTDGISGLGMGQAFTVSDQILPYTYTTRKIPDAPQDHINNVGFVMVGLTHTIENNQWNTAVRANMIYLKDKTEFSGSVVKVDARTGVFGVNSINEISDSRLSVENFANYPVANSSYSNIKFGRGNLGSPQSDRINPNLLEDINNAAIKSGVVVTVTTAVSGHKTFTSNGTISRHSTGNAVDIAIIDGISVSKKSQIENKVNEFVKQLTSLGYSKNIESGKQKSVLTYGFKNHEDHIHISNIV